MDSQFHGLVGVAETTGGAYLEKVGWLLGAHSVNEYFVPSPLLSICLLAARWVNNSVPSHAPHRNVLPRHNVCLITGLKAMEPVAHVMKPLKP